MIEGGVHISKLAYEDLTWENSSDPESFAPWYTMIMGHYTPSRQNLAKSRPFTLGGPWSIPCGQCLDPTLGKFTPLYGPHLMSHRTQPIG